MTKPSSQKYDLIYVNWDIAPLNQIKVLPYKDKSEWKLEQKYNIGKKNKVEETVS